jgi:hypothetical protein
MSFGVVALGLFGFFLLISPFGCLEHLIYETLASVVVWGLVLSLGLENTDAIQEAFKFTSLGRYSLLHHSRSTALTEQSTFLFLSWPLDELGWSV